MKESIIMSNTVDRTSKGLSAAMFDEMDKLNAGESTPQHAQAQKGLAATIVCIKRLEMDHARFVASGRSASDDSNNTPLLPMS